MAKDVVIIFAYGGTKDFHNPGAHTDAIQVHGFLKETISTADIEVTTTIAATDERQMCHVHNLGNSDVWVAFGETPDATQNPRFPVPARTSFPFKSLKPGDKVSIIERAAEE